MPQLGVIFTKELVLKLHFLFVVGAETKCTFWGKQKKERSSAEST